MSGTLTIPAPAKSSAAPLMPALVHEAFADVPSCALPGCCRARRCPSSRRSEVERSGLAWWRGGGGGGVTGGETGVSRSVAILAGAQERGRRGARRRSARRTSPRLHIELPPIRSGPLLLTGAGCRAESAKHAIDESRIVPLSYVVASASSGWGRSGSSRRPRRPGSRPARRSRPGAGCVEAVGDRRGRLLERDHAPVDSERGLIQPSSVNAVGDVQGVVRRGR